MNENENGGIGSFFEEHKKKLAAFAVCLLVLILIIALPSRQKKEGEPQPDAQTGKTVESETAGKGATEAAGTGKTAAETAEGEAEEEAEEGMTAETAEAGATVGAQTAASRSRSMDELQRRLREELKGKSGDWSLYLYRFDTEEEIGINADEPMISASLIKLYIAGCYLEKTAKGEISDDYQDQLFLMLSQSDNGSTNTLIDLLGMDAVNEFMEKHGYPAGRLNRKMLEQNGTENYTSSEDCGRVLRAVYEERYVSRDASNRIMEALRAQIERNRAKIPAGVPDGVETANKTGELFTKNADGVNVDVQNDAAVIFAEDHPYVLVVMTSVPGAGEDEMHRQIAELSREVYETVCGEKEEGIDTSDTEEKPESEGLTEAEQELTEESATGEGSTEEEQELPEESATGEGSTEEEQELPEKSAA